jgi:transposase
VTVPWAGSDSGFTLLFEAFVMQLAKVMPVLDIARLVGEHDTLIWWMVNHYVDTARSKADHSAVTQVGMDETAARRGHDYVSLFVDMKERRVLFVSPGKDSATVEAFAEDLKAHQGDPKAITEVSLDMSPAFIKGVAAQLPNASITFDKFHTIKLINEAVDEVRRLERKDHPELAGSRYIRLKNPTNLTANRKNTLATLDLPRGYLKTAKAYQIRLAFQDLYLQPHEDAKKFLDKWFFWATHSRIQPIIDVARTIRAHQDGILRWFTSKISNGILEGINSLVQAAKAKARGYRSNRNFASIIYPSQANSIFLVNPHETAKNQNCAGNAENPEVGRLFSPLGTSRRCKIASCAADLTALPKLASFFQFAVVQNCARNQPNSSPQPRNRS